MMIQDSAIKSLPTELLVDVLRRVASSSFTDFFNSKLCCRDFLGAASDDYILQNVSLDKFPVIHQWLKSDEANLFLNRCVESGNPEALYRRGMVEYFSYVRMEQGLEYLKRAAEKGHIEALYVYGIILLSRGGQSSIEGLKILNSIKNLYKNSIQIQELRQRIKTVIHMMWINNHIVRQQEDLCCHEKSSIRYRETWEGRVIEDDGNSCDACKWDGEVNIFCNMLKGIV